MSAYVSNLIDWSKTAFCSYCIYCCDHALSHWLWTATIRFWQCLSNWYSHQHFWWAQFESGPRSHPRHVHRAICQEQRKLGDFMWFPYQFYVIYHTSQYVYIYILCTYVYMATHMIIYICICVYMYICIYVYMYLCIYVYMYICIYVYMYICIYVYMYICIYVYMYMQYV